jgi:hypothetical protein
MNGIQWVFFGGLACWGGFVVALLTWALVRIGDRPTPTPFDRQ